MRPISRRLLISVVCTAMLLLPLVQPAMAQNAAAKQIESSPETMTADLLLRPFSFVGTVLGTCIYIISSPFSAAGGNLKEANEKLVIEPAKYTFTRPLGSF